MIGTLTVCGGTIAVGATRDAVVIGNGTSFISIAGTAAQINAALMGLAFWSTSDYRRSASITIVTSDDTTLGCDVVTINILPLTHEATELAGAEGGSRIQLMVLADDSEGSDHHTITAINNVEVVPGGQVSVLHGGVTLHSDDSLSFTPDADYKGGTSFDYTVVACGRSETVRVALAELSHADRSRAKARAPAA